jgi:hypothetical protein
MENKEEKRVSEGEADKEKGEIINLKEKEAEFRFRSQLHSAKV